MTNNLSLDAIKAFTFEQVDALTRTELIDLLTEAGRDFKEVNGRNHKWMAGQIWTLVRKPGQEAEATTEVAVIPAAEARPVRKSKKQPKPCKCGCGEWTKGGTFRPGHDARYYAQLHHTAEIGLQHKFLPETINPAEMALYKPEVSRELAATA